MGSLLSAIKRDERAFGDRILWIAFVMVAFTVMYFAGHYLVEVLL